MGEQDLNNALLIFGREQFQNNTLSLEESGNSEALGSVRIAS